MEIDDLRRENAELRAANAELRALAAEREEARRQAEQRAEELAALNRVTLALTNVTDLYASLTLAARELTEVFATRGSTVTLIDEDGGHAEVVAEYFTDPSLPSVIGLPVPLDVPAWKRLAEEGAAILIDNPMDAESLGPVREVMRERAVSQLLVAPLLSRGALIGNLSVSHAPGRRFAPNEIQLAQTLAGPVAQAVENARLLAAAQRARETAETANRELERLSKTDVVTGLPNRRQFHDVLEAEWRRAQRAGVPVAVVMIDIDFFKAFNDRYGHQLGDDCLARVGSALEAGLQRAGDFAGRYGGEEFVVVIPGSDAADAERHAERICERVRALAIPHAASAAAPIVTVSAGCAAAIPAAGTTPDGLVASADAALYEAKRAGRNRVVVSAAPSRQ